MSRSQSDIVEAPKGSSRNETHISTLKSPSCTDTWFSRSHEDSRRPWRDQRKARKRSQAPLDLTPGRGFMLGRIMRSADFELLLSSSAKARSTHFAAHYVPVRPAQSKSKRTNQSSSELSTVNSEGCAQVVDDASRMGIEACWFGIVISKRHARLAATRNLLRRQIRAAILRHECRLARGMWLVRLRAPFASSDYVSATSAALRSAARDELDGLLKRASH